MQHCVNNQQTFYWFCNQNKAFETVNCLKIMNAQLQTQKIKKKNNAKKMTDLLLYSFIFLVVLLGYFLKKGVCDCCFF